MKKSICLMALLFSTVAIFAQDPIGDKFRKDLLSKDRDNYHSRNAGDLLDSNIHWTWNEIDQSWDYFNREQYQYDDKGNNTVDVSSYWEGMAWQLTHKSEFTYNDNGKFITWFEQEWDGTMWVNSDSTTYELNEYDNSTLTLLQSWNGSGWDNYYRFLYTYNANNLRDSSLYQSWNGSNWVNSKLITNTYENDKIKTAVTQNWDMTDGWVNYSQKIYTYGANGLTQELLNQLWDETDWVDNNHVEYEYDGHGNNTLTLTQISLGAGMWQNSDQHVYTYTAADELASDLRQKWVNNDWENDYYYTEVYDDRHNLIDGVIQFWSDAWINSDSTHYYYTLSSGLADSPTPSSLSVYPNPASSMLMVDEPGNWTIYSNTGQVTMKSNKTGQNVQQIDISRLVPGIYTLVIRQGNGTAVKQFLKL